MRFLLQHSSRAARTSAAKAVYHQGKHKQQYEEQQRGVASPVAFLFPTGTIHTFIILHCVLFTHYLPLCEC